MAPWPLTMSPSEDVIRHTAVHSRTPRSRSSTARLVTGTLIASQTGNSTMTASAKARPPTPTAMAVARTTCGTDVSGIGARALAHAPATMDPETPSFYSTDVVTTVHIRGTWALRPGWAMRIRWVGRGLSLRQLSGDQGRRCPDSNRTQPRGPAACSAGVAAVPEIGD